MLGNTASFWSAVIQKKNTAKNIPSQERIFIMKPVNKKLRMTFSAKTHTIHYVLETLNV